MYILPENNLPHKNVSLNTFCKWTILIYIADGEIYFPSSSFTGAGTCSNLSIRARESIWIKIDSDRSMSNLHSALSSSLHILLLSGISSRFSVRSDIKIVGLSLTIVEFRASIRNVYFDRTVYIVFTAKLAKVRAIFRNVAKGNIVINENTGRSGNNEHSLSQQFNFAPGMHYFLFFFVLIWINMKKSMKKSSRFVRSN